VIRGEELRVGFSVTETVVQRVSASSFECTVNTLLEHSLPDGVTKTLSLLTEKKSIKGNTIKVILILKGVVQCYFEYSCRVGCSADCSPLSTGILYGRLQRVTIPEAVIIQFVLLKINKVLLETC